MTLMQQLFMIRSPSRALQGQVQSTPRWVRAVWAGYDAIAEVGWGLLALFCVVAPVVAAVIAALIITH